MTDRQPIETVNLDRYGNPALTRSQVHDLLESGPKGPLVGRFARTDDLTSPGRCGLA